MKHNKGFATAALLIVLGILVVGGVGYVAVGERVSVAPTETAIVETIEKDDGVQTEPGDHLEVDHEANEGIPQDAKISIAWRFTDAGEIDAMPQTSVGVAINNIPYQVGTFVGSCNEVGATGGIDGLGLLAGELSAAQCWFAGGGNEIGVFAHEDGGVDIMVGELGEGEAGTGLFRGNFVIKETVEF